MKRDFFDYLIELMYENKNIYFISAGLGWPRTDELKEKYPDRYIQVEASEQTALDIAVGLASEDKIPFVYTITPFFYRGFETIRTYINKEKLHVILIGAGRDKDYKHDGFSHDASDIHEILNTQKNIIQYYPEDILEMKDNVGLAVSFNGPAFISLRR